MHVQHLRLHNYRSIQHTEFTPTRFSVIVGPNGAGKSNFVSAFDFLSDVYQHGLETAIAKKGGYENIAFRRQRRSKAPIAVELTILCSRTEIDFVRPEKPTNDSCILRHSFSFKAKGSAVRADYEVVDEAFSVWDSHSTADILDRDPDLYFTRDENKLKASHRHQRTDSWINKHQRFAEGIVVSPQELMTEYPISPIIARGRRLLSGMKLLQINPHIARGASAPSPNPTMGSAGTDLPSVIRWLQFKHPKIWHRIVAEMREIVPQIEDIRVDLLHTRTQGIFVVEEGTTRPWTAEDVSDGTIRALGFLVAVHDPRNSALLIEEPENSMHPWIIKGLVKQFRRTSEQKTVVMTTHSPSVIDAMNPLETWVAFRGSKGTEVRNICDLSPSVNTSWKDGHTRMSEYLDAGLIPQAVPGGNE